jgi:hypothetical protein
MTIMICPNCNEGTTENTIGSVCNKCGRSPFEVVMAFTTVFVSALEMAQLRSSLSELEKERDTWRDAHDAIYAEIKEVKGDLIAALRERDELRGIVGITYTEEQVKEFKRDRDLARDQLDATRAKLADTETYAEGLATKNCPVVAYSNGYEKGYAEATKNSEIREGNLRHEGRMEALNAVFQINGPSRAITRLKEKDAAEAKECAAIPSPPKGCCEWVQSEGVPTFWDTGCGAEFEWDADFKFCPHCSEAISIKAEVFHDKA